MVVISPRIATTAGGKVAAFVFSLTLAACTSSTGDGASPGPSSPSSPTRSMTESSTASTPPTSTSPGSSRPPSSSAPSPAERALDALSLRERAGQLLMVDCPSTGVSGATAAAIRDDHVGSVILDGNTTSGVDGVAAVTARLRRLARRTPGLFVATDQEGGEVQRLRGDGFTRVVSAVEQGRIDPGTLRRDAAGWGRELRAAGVNVNLAPVLDTVPSGFGSNPPIGDLDREYGNTPARVTSHGVAVLRGLLDAGVDPTVKHFPGLGRVTGNTDVASGVTDSITTRDSSYLDPFRAAVRAGTPFVMMSTAVYSHLDVGTPAAFSKTIVTGLLRGTLGFRGVVISDDVGNARQVSGYSVGERAVKFVAAGGDIVLTVDATQAGTMVDALVARAKSDPAFRTLVDAAALRVLQAKQARGLL